MHAGMEVVSADLLRMPGHIASANRGYVSVRWQDGRMEEISRDVVDATLSPVAKRLLLVAKETFKDDSRDMYPGWLKGSEYEAWDDGEILWLSSETRSYQLDGIRREGALELFEQREADGNG